MSTRLRREPLHPGSDTIPTRRFARDNLPQVSGTIVFHPVTPGGNLRAATMREILENALQRYAWDTRALSIQIADFAPPAALPTELEDMAVDLRTCVPPR